MNKLLIALIAFLILFLLSPLRSQGVDLEQNPPSVKWLQTNSEHFQLIYPTTYAKDAQKVMTYLEAMYQPNAKNLGYSPKKVPVIIQNQTVVSNGFVDPMFFRSEFFLTPPQDGFNGSGEWMQALAVHEGRHLVQLSKYRSKRSNILRILMGDLGGAASSLIVPLWFYEGDAVGTETALTQSGRGRLPDFDLVLRNGLLNKKPYKYAVAINGSFKNPVPNRYVMGYFMTSYLKNRSGANVYDTILSRVFDFKSTYWSATKKATGLTVPQSYRATMADATEKWTSQLKNVEETQAEILPHQKNKFWTNYNYPQLLPDGRILAIRNGISDVSQLVIFDKNEGEKPQNERVLHTLGTWLDAGTLSTENNKVVWSEAFFDPRYEQRTYSVVKIMDIPTGEVTLLTHKTKFQAPALSPDASKIVVVENAPDGGNNLVILNAKTGAEISRLTHPQNAAWLQPKWEENGKNIVAITSINQSKSMVSADISTGAVTELFNMERENFRNPRVIGDYVFYDAPINGIDNIYAFDKNSKTHYQVTNRKYGAYNLSGNKEQLLFNDYQLDGFQIAKVRFDPQMWRTVDAKKLGENKIVFTEKFSKEELTNDVFANLPEKTYPTTSFKSLSNGIRPYVWGPAVDGANSDPTVPKIGIGVADLLRTTKFSAAVGYDLNEKNIVYSAGLNYEKWLPKLSLNYDNAYRKSTGLDAARLPISDSYNVQTIEAGASIPLNLTRSKYRQQLQFGAFFAQNQVSGFDVPIRKVTDIPNGTFQNMRYSLGYNLIHKTNSLDIAPRKGFSVAANFRNTPFAKGVKGEQFAMNTRLFLPGLAKHHAILLRYALQNETNSSYRFSNAILLPRGSDNTRIENLNIFTAEYKLPIAYPDLPLTPFANMKRIKTALWTDFAKGKNRNNTLYENHTTGIDLSFDIAVIGLFTIDIGVRAIYDVTNKKTSIVPILFNFGF
jgi:hypothetical protein